MDNQRYQCRAYRPLPASTLEQLKTGVIPRCRAKPMTLRRQDQLGQKTTSIIWCACPDPALVRFVEALARYQADFDFEDFCREAGENSE